METVSPSGATKHSSKIEKMDLKEVSSHLLEMTSQPQKSRLIQGTEQRLSESKSILTIKKLLYTTVTVLNEKSMSYTP